MTSGRSPKQEEPSYRSKPGPLLVPYMEANQHFPTGLFSLQLRVAHFGKGCSEEYPWNHVHSTEADADPTTLLAKPSSCQRRLPSKAGVPHRRLSAHPRSAQAGNGDVILNGLWSRFPRRANEVVAGGRGWSVPGWRNEGGSVSTSTEENVYREKEDD